MSLKAYIGVFGYAWKVFFVDIMGWSFQRCLLLANVLPFLYYISFTYLDLSTYEQILDEEEMLQQEISGAETSREEIIAVSFLDKIKVFRSLWLYTVPLFLVFTAEYAMQSGPWASIGFPVEDKEARERFYTESNWLYQLGVFVSRSSRIFFSLSLKVLWMLPILQVLLLVFFTVNAAFHSWWSNSLLVLAFVVGLLGGAVYVHCYCIMARELKSNKEFSMGAVSVAATGGTVLATVLAVFLQGCLYGINAITGTY